MSALPGWCAALLTLFGALMVWSATWDESAAWGLGPEGRAQWTWWLVATIAALIAARVPWPTWQRLAPLAWIASVLAVMTLLALAGTALVPSIKGQHNWLVLGPLRIQPVELVKLGALLGCAWIGSRPWFEPQRLTNVGLLLAIAGLPAVLLAREDLGSALTFPAMAIGVLIAVGTPWRYLGLLAGIALVVIAIGVAALPKEGPKSYQWKRIQAWLHPDDYALTEAYQTVRSVNSIGSGQVLGKGWGQGDQNRLGWIPEKHTDLIAAVVGEELGLWGCLLLLTLYVALAWSLLALAVEAREPSARLYLCGGASLLIGQAVLNLAVATGLMPVTGVTLPFISYGGSSLLGCWLVIGIARSASTT